MQTMYRQESTARPRLPSAPAQTFNQAQDQKFICDEEVTEEMLEEPTQKTTMGRRIVSRGEYMWLQSQTVGVVLLGLGIGAALIVCSLIVGLLVPILVYYGVIAPLVEPGYGLCRWAVALGCILALGATITAFMCKLGDWLERTLDFKGTKNVVPIYDVDAIALPAAESLVRAASQPAQEQKNMLMRAAVQAHEQHEEQLLRAAE